jgi:hypothetical protein
MQRVLVNGRASRTRRWRADVHGGREKTICIREIEFVEYLNNFKEEIYERSHFS